MSIRTMASSKNDSTSFPVVGSTGELEVGAEAAVAFAGVVATVTGVHCACTTKFPSDGENDELNFVPPV